MHDLGSTIVAVASAAGRGGVGCLRISGPEAETVAGRLFSPHRRRAAEPRAGGPPVFGRFVGRDGLAIDHGYLVLFARGASFTGEPTAEVWTHGSPAILDELVAAALAAGAELAEPGEFTYRALRHGRLDLARAEAVRDLIEARTLYQARVAFRQAEGALSRRLVPLCERLEEWIARGEAAIEFVDEAEAHLPPRALAGAIEAVRAQLVALLAEFRQGRTVREGATLVVIGPPNAGKSSLFNRLLARERAIVSEWPGTTRDTLEEQIALDGIPVRLVDTAGLRDAADPVELEGVRRAELARREADLVLAVLDGARPVEPSERAAVERAVADTTGAVVVVVNKSDLPTARSLATGWPAALLVSAKTGSGVADLRAALRERLVGGAPFEDPVLTNARHGQAVERALAAVERATVRDLPDELVLEELALARRELGEIRGEFGVDALYERIFSTFCIGK